MSERDIEIVEVSPRDGLQNDKVTFTTAAKAKLIELAVAAGLRRLEATSFVNPKRVPQMADADQLMAMLPRVPGVSYIGLVMNQRGLARAVAAGIDEINLVVCATDSFNRRNQGVETKETLAMQDEIAAEARAHGIPYSVSIATAFGCPFEGEVPLARLSWVLERVIQQEPSEIALADTIGVASPRDVRERFAFAAEKATGIPLRCHFHNTRNTGIANALAAYEAGVRVIDASIGGIGGCPFAPRATGNIPTEDVAYMFERMRVRTGLSLPRLIEAAQWLEDQLGRSVPALLGKAGLFPPAGQAAA